LVALGRGAGLALLGWRDDCQSGEPLGALAWRILEEDRLRRSLTTGGHREKHAPGDRERDPVR
jgi:hypothetical protein